MSEDGISFETLTLAINESKQEIALAFAENKLAFSEFKEETQSEIEALQKQFSTLFLAFGELSTLFQVFSKFIFDQATDEEKKILDDELRSKSKEFVKILQESKEKVQYLDEQEAQQKAEQSNQQEAQ